MRIGEVAHRAGVNVETLRYYERRGLLAEPARGPNGHRSYDEEAVRLIRAIKERRASASPSARSRSTCRRIAVAGLDRWLGGTHLSAGQSVWRWDPVDRRVRRG
jgi:hypothetical protein